MASAPVRGRQFDLSQPEELARSHMKLSAQPPASSAGHDLDITATHRRAGTSCYWRVVTRLYSR
jgi:hypothetical protein